ncbi:MAG: Peptidoglycan-binding lysin protein [Firmicutes bacterium]|nr:Peptidoglycan-binding lysin protein [Bacillota bacterium]
MALRMKQFILMLAVVAMQYTVNSGDTLQSIAEQYCQGDDPRQVAEFREGIRELNYDSIGESDVWEGVVLEINRWM